MSSTNAGTRGQGAKEVQGADCKGNKSSWDEARASRNTRIWGSRLGWPLKSGQGRPCPSLIFRLQTRRTTTTDANQTRGARAACFPPRALGITATDVASELGRIVSQRVALIFPFLSLLFVHLRRFVHLLARFGVCFVVWRGFCCRRLTWRLPKRMEK